MLKNIEKSTNPSSVVIQTKIKKKFNKRQRSIRKKKRCKKDKIKSKDNDVKSKLNDGAKTEVRKSKGNSSTGTENLEKKNLKPAGLSSIKSIKKRKLPESKQNDLAIENPRKKRKNKENLPKKEDQVKKFKPVVEIKNPEDYSANWKKLKDVIRLTDKKNNHKAVDKGSIDHNNSGAVSGVSIESKVQRETKEDRIWFDDVDPILLEDKESIAKLVKYETNVNGLDKVSKSEDSLGDVSSGRLTQENSFAGLTKTIALDCEMVGGGPDGEQDLLARVSMVNHFGNCIYDKHVKPKEEIVDYRTPVSGIRPSDLVNGECYETVQKDVDAILGGRVLVGHGLSNDFDCLLLSHPRHMIRDTSKYKPFVQLFGGRTPSLKKLSERVLGVQIQCGEHDSVQDAQAAMRLYTLNRKDWEARANKNKKMQQRRDKQRVEDGAATDQQKNKKKKKKNSK